LAAGLFVAGGVHAVKSLAIRPIVTATTAGIGDVAVSIAEDIISTAVSILSILVPVLVFILVVVVIAWSVHKFWRRENQRRLLKP
jgi:heme/copper-type cytochrome/quinol oxidase subunit 2